MSKDYSKIGNLNLFLIVLAFLLAYIAPVTTFVVAYAILGPLHYLTQLNWLKDTTFSRNSNLLSVTVIIAAIISSVLFFFEYYTNGSDWYLYRNIFTIVILLTCYVVYVIIQRVKVSIAILILLPLIILSLLLTKNTIYLILLGVMFASLIHVYIFTILHMLSGYLKSKTKIDLGNVALMIFIPFLIIITPNSWCIHNWELIDSNTFIIGLSYNLNYLFGLSPNDFSRIIFVKGSWFIAFTYLYHYLNWFSKTKIIHWDNSLTKKKTIIIVIMSVLCSAVYIIKFEYGLLTTLFLSYLHVYAEIPINILSVKNIFKVLLRK